MPRNITNPIQLHLLTLSIELYHNINDLSNKKAEEKSKFTLY